MLAGNAWKIKPTNDPYSDTRQCEVAHFIAGRRKFGQLEFLPRRHGPRRRCADNAHISSKEHLLASELVKICMFRSLQDYHL
jgi:hypothetical protein